MTRRRERLPPDPALLAGRYRHDGELGSGASGRVIALLDESGARRVAKILAPDAGLRARWEFDALLAVSSPHLARARELLRTRGRVEAPFQLPPGSWVLVQDRAEGERSSDVLSRMADPSERVERVVRAAIGVARALAALHAVGLTHGDVKPDNVLLEAGHATLVDLGAVAPFGRHASLDGTLAFMAPEAREGERSSSTDLYALGATMVAWLGGSAPRAPSDLVFAPALPTGLDTLLRALLAPRIADRPRDAEAVLEALGDTTARARRHRPFARPPLVGFGDAVRRLLLTLETHGWAVVVGPPSSGRSRLTEEALRQLQEQESLAGRETPTLRSSDGWPSALGASTLLHVHAEAPARVAIPATERILVAGRIAGHPHRVVLERDDARGFPDEHVVRVPPLEVDEISSLLEVLVGARAPAATLRAVLDATSGLAGRVVRGAESLSAMGLDPLRASEWPLAGRLAGAPALPRAAALVASLATALGGELLLDGSDLDAEYAEGARALVRGGMATIREDGALVVHASARRPPSPARRAHLLARARALPLAGLSRAVALANGGDGDAADRLALDLALHARARGQPERAADWLTRFLGAVPVRSAAARDDVVIALVDAERAMGEIARARATLAASARPSPRATLASAELARLLGDVEGAIDAARSLEETPELGPDASALIARASLTREPALARHRASQLIGAPGLVSARALEVLSLVALSEGAALEALEHARFGRRASAAIEPSFTRLATDARLASLEAQALALDGQLDPARRAHRESARLASLAGDRLLEATFRANDGLAALEAGELTHAIEALEASAGLFLRLARPRELGRTLANLANAYALAGDDARASGLLDEADRVLAGERDPDAATLVAIVRSELALRRGKLAQARAVLEPLRRDLLAADVNDLARIASLRALSLRAVSPGSSAPNDAGLTTVTPPHASALVAAEAALTRARLHLASEDPRSAERAMDDARAEVIRGRVGFELQLRTHALEAEVYEALGDKRSARDALARLRAVVEPTLRDLPPELASRFRQIPWVRRALAEGSTRGAPAASVAERALDALATLARERGLAPFEERLAEIALELASAERSFVVEWRRDGLVVRARKGAAEREPDARPSRAAVARALRETLVVSTDAVSESDASSSVHALALRSVLAIELGPRPKNAGPRVLVVDDPLRPDAFDPAIVGALRSIAEVAGPLLLALLEDERRRQPAGSALGRGREDGASPEDELDPFATFVHEEPSSRRLVTDARRLSASDLPILLVGETGVGKDLLARAIHRASSRRHAPFVAERGANLSGSLADALIFGHVRGAFSGAEEAREGIFALANGGTLYLDGIDEIPIEIQAKLLRVLVEGEVRPVGSSRVRRLDVRVIASMRTSPSDALDRGLLREDFYYRVAGARLTIAPLRERPRDLDALIDRVIAQRPGARLSARAREALRARAWPGNARELEHTLGLALLSASGRELDVEALERIAPRPDLARRDRASPERSLHAQRRELTRELVLRTLERHGGNRTHAARALGLSRYGLQKILRRLEGGGSTRGSKERPSK